LTSTVSINLFEFFFWIAHLSNPLFNDVFGANELLEVDSAITSGVDSLESLEVFESLSQSNQKDSELFLFNIVSSILGLSRDGVLGELEGSHDCWLRVEHILNLDNISDSFLGFGEGHITIAIVVEAFPVLLSHFNLIWICF
jgi:hypothetical protein